MIFFTDTQRRVFCGIIRSGVRRFGAHSTLSDGEIHDRIADSRERVKEGK